MNDLKVTEYNNNRVLTTQQIAEAYGTDNKTISYNFNHNKDRYVEGKHFICLSGDELRAFRENHDLPNNLNKLYLWTEKGALLHAKSLNTDKAWEVYDYLVDNYFNKRELVDLDSLSTELKAIIVVDKRVTQVEQKVNVVEKQLKDFKNDMPLLAIEIDKITEAVKKKGVAVLGGKNSNAYKNSSLRTKLYQDLHRDVRRQFGVSTYKAIKRNQCEQVLAMVESYKPPIFLDDLISSKNSQMSIAL